MEKNIKLTEEEMNILKEYEPQLNSALNYGTLRGVSRAMSSKILSIIDKNPTRAYNLGCSSCVINLYKRAANIYNYNLDLIEKSKQEQNNEINAEANGEDKSKRKTKKKQNTQVQSEA